MRGIVIEERLSRGLDVTAADLEFLARRKRKRTGQSADDNDGTQVCPTCNGSGRIRAVPRDDEDEEDDAQARRLYGSSEDDE
jgi:hypothetical protein